MSGCGVGFSVEFQTPRVWGRYRETGKQNKGEISDPTRVGKIRYPNFFTKWLRFQTPRVWGRLQF